MFLMQVDSWVAVLLLCLCIVPIAILIIFAIVVRVKKAIKKKKNLDESIGLQEKDLEQRQMFIEAYGGDDNIISFDIERNKISVKVKDTELVQGDKLKDLGANGVLLLDGEVRCSYGDRAVYIYELMK